MHIYIQTYTGRVVRLHSHSEVYNMGSNQVSFGLDHGGAQPASLYILLLTFFFSLFSFSVCVCQSLCVYVSVCLCNMTRMDGFICMCLYVWCVVGCVSVSVCVFVYVLVCVSFFFFQLFCTFCFFSFFFNSQFRFARDMSPLHAFTSTFTYFLSTSHLNPLRGDFLLIDFHSRTNMHTYIHSHTHAHIHKHTHMQVAVVCNIFASQSFWKNFPITPHSIMGTCRRESFSGDMCVSLRGGRVFEIPSIS
jgi:hypothetical protein